MGTQKKQKLTYWELLRQLESLWGDDGKMLCEVDLLDILDDLATAGVKDASWWYFKMLAAKRRR